MPAEKRWCSAPKHGHKDAVVTLSALVWSALLCRMSPARKGWRAGLPELIFGTANCKVQVRLLSARPPLHLAFLAFFLHSLFLSCPPVHWRATRGISSQALLMAVVQALQLVLLLALEVRAHLGVEGAKEWIARSAAASEPLYEDPWYKTNVGHSPALPAASLRHPPNSHEWSRRLHSFAPSSFFALTPRANPTPPLALSVLCSAFAHVPSCPLVLCAGHHDRSLAGGLDGPHRIVRCGSPQGQ